VTVPLFVLNQVSDERCEWLVPGMLKDKIQALLKSLPSARAAALCRCPSQRKRGWPSAGHARALWQGSLTDALLKQVRDETSLDVKRADFKLDMLQPALFMNFRVVDEHGRQLGTGRNLGALKAEWGAKARGAFQALAGLKLAGRRQRVINMSQKCLQRLMVKRKQLLKQEPGWRSACPARQTSQHHAIGPLNPRWPALHHLDVRRAARADGNPQGRQTLIGFPGADRRRRRRHHRGVRRARGGRRQTPRRPAPPVCAADQGRAQVPGKEHPRPAKNGRGLHAAGHADEELRAAQIIDVALDRAFLLDPLPTDEAAFKRRVEEGRGA
jgi:ATP-dependent helicase HrpA